MKETALFKALEAKLDELRPDLLILDTLADLFGGDEIKRPHARQFIGMLRGLAIKYGVTILLLSHPSLTGITSGTGTSGSTAWSNSVRSRLYFERPKGSEGDDDDDRRILTTKKANYGRAGGEVVLRWRDGVFVLDGHSVGSFDKFDAEAKAEHVFLGLLAEREGQGRDVSPKPSQSYAPSLFAVHPDAKGVSKKAFAAAMERAQDETHCCRNNRPDVAARYLEDPSYRLSDRSPPFITACQPGSSTALRPLPTTFQGGAVPPPLYPPGGSKPPFRGLRPPQRLPPPCLRGGFPMTAEAPPIADPKLERRME